METLPREQGARQKYRETHPFITFRCEANRFSHDLWMNLGEARSKCEHVAGVPLQPDLANKLHEVYMAKGVMATTAIEGNTLSEDQVRSRLEGKSNLPPSQEYMGREVDNVVEAVNLVASQTLVSDTTDITIEEIKEYNRIVLGGLELDDWVIPGEIRDRSVGVGSYRAAPAEDCEYLLKQMCKWLNGPDFCVSDEEGRVVFGLLRAILAHLYIAWIHPFGDGNGRTARLLEFKILFTAGLPSPVCHLLSNHYNRTRPEYYRQLQKSHQSADGVSSFVAYAVQGFIDGLKEQLQTIRTEQWEIAWRDYIYDLFADRDGYTESAPNKRRRHLILDLSADVEDGWLRLIDAENISTRVVRDYADLTRKTFLRDVRALEKMELVEVHRGLIRPKRETVLAFLPPSRAM